MIGISNKKLVLLNKLLELTNMQKIAISKSDMQKIDDILNEKDELIKSIDALDVKFLTCFSELKAKNNIKKLDELDSLATPSLKELKEVPGEDKPKAGALINASKTKVESIIAAREAEFKKAELNVKLMQEKVDVTLDLPKRERGSLHPISADLKIGRAHV